MKTQQLLSAALLASAALACSGHPENGTDFERHFSVSVTSITHEKFHSLTDEPIIHAPHSGFFACLRISGVEGDCADTCTGSHSCELDVPILDYVSETQIKKGEVVLEIISQPSQQVCRIYLDSFDQGAFWQDLSGSEEGAEAICSTTVVWNEQ